MIKKSHKLFIGIIIIIIILFLLVLLQLDENDRDFKNKNLQNNNLQIYSSNLNILLKLFINYDGDNNKEMFRRINFILEDSNIPLLYDYYGESADEIISHFKNIKEIEIKIREGKEEYNSKRKTINDEIKSLENQLFLLDEKIDENIDYISIIVGRRFDTEPLSGKGVYEAADMDNYKKVVLIASEDEIKNYQGYQKKYLVKDLGETETTVTMYNAYTSWEQKEYFTCYITVPESQNPFVIKEKLSALKNTREKLEKEILANEDDLKNKYNPLIKDNINKIMEKIITFTKTEQGDAAAQFILGVCYYNGTGVVKDEQEAVKWYHKAAEQGDAAAQFILGVCYYNGTGVVKDEQEAVKWYHKAAEQGLEEAKKELQEMNY